MRLVPYDPGWRALFEEEKARIRASLAESALDVQHVGSTAVPGIDAKPIIDMAIGVDDPNGAEAVIRAALESIGWELRHEAVLTGNRLFFVKGQPRTHHLHVVERDSDVWTDMLLFRDFLLGHPDVAAQYLFFKRRLAEKFAAKREAYTRGKGPFIESALEVARGERPLEELTTDIPE
ncbi:MAG: GrpB family protein [Armatimonadota bacterium]